MIINTASITAYAGDELLIDYSSSNPMGRAGQPMELAPAYVFLASKDSAYMSGQILHINGRQIVNG